MNVYKSFLKRIFDILLAGFALVVLSPFLVVLAGIIRIRIGSPIFFFQQRPGLAHKSFWLVKFRTMTSETDSKGKLLPDSDRLTNFGRWLRTTSLDEVPELWNVLRGDMSLVGPRPLLMHYVEHYSDFEKRRHEVRPGITGLAQVLGRNSLSWKQKFLCDIQYVDDCSCPLDLWIFWKTIGAVLSRTGITDKNSDTMIPFVPFDDAIARQENQHPVESPVMPQAAKKNGQWPYFDDEQIQAAVRVLQSGQVNYWTGSEVQLFEKEFASHVGVDHAVAVANGTVALELALLSLGICEGDEVIVPSRTFIATASAVSRIGATPVVADIDSQSQAITVNTIKQVRTKRTKAIIVVHLGGWPANMTAIMAFAKSNGFAVIEDCSQAHGATYDGQHVGSFGNISTFSFCQDKIMTTAGEGGMVVTNDELLWEKAWSFKDHGKSIDKTLRADGDGTFRFVHDSLGTNWRMTEIQAAVGRCQLKQLTNWLNIRSQNAAVIRDGLQDIKVLSFPVPGGNLRVSYYRLYGFLDCSQLASSWSRDEVVRQLQASGVNVGIGSCGIIQSEQGFSKFGKVSETPVGELLHQQSLAFAVHPTLSDEALTQTVRVVRKVLMKATGQQRSEEIAA